MEVAVNAVAEVCGRGRRCERLIGEDAAGNIHAVCLGCVARQ